MSNDQFTEITSQSWFGRIGKSFTGIIFGIIMVIAAFPLLFWNEGRAVKTAKALEEGESLVKELTSGSESLLENKLVHYTGQAETNETLNDQLFGISVNELKLKRVVEMYQWKERKNTKKRKKIGGGTETITTYSYSKQWSDDQINSSSFKKSQDHYNPEKPLKNETTSANRITLDNYNLTSSFTSQIDNYKVLSLDNNIINDIRFNYKFKPIVMDNKIYFSNDQSTPQIGDLRVFFKYVPKQIISIVGRYTNNTLTDYKATNGRTLALLGLGSKSANEMFAKAKTDNSLLTWGLRIGGFFLMMIGFLTILKPLSVLGDIIPFIGSIVGAGTAFISFILAVFLSLITIGVGWIFYRPVLGSLLISSAIVFVFIMKRKLKRK